VNQEVFARFRMVTKIAVDSSHSCRKGASFFTPTTPDSTSSSVITWPFFTGNFFPGVMRDLLDLRIL
jgi:hypothetical protein